MKFVASLLAAAAVACTTGCTGGDGGGGGGGTQVITVADYGGFIAVEASEGSAYLSAVFFSDLSVTPDPGPIRIGATDECVLEEDTGNPTVSVTFLDVGADVTATSGANTIVAVKDTSGGIFYSGDGTGDVDMTYDISVAGSGDVAAGQIASIYVPPPMVQPSSLTIVPGTPLNITWTPTGSDVVEIYLEDFDFTVSYQCSVEDDGSFTVPGDVTTAIGADGDVYLWNHSSDVITFEGRKVVLSGEPF